MTTPLSSVRVEGLASFYDRADLAGDVVRPGAFDRSLARGGGVRMLFQHEPDEPVGLWDRVESRPEGLFVSGRIEAHGPRGRAAARLVRLGAVDGLSIGYRTRRARRRGDGVRELLEIELWEVSVVTFPMAPQARLRVVDASTSRSHGRFRPATHQGVIG